MCDFYSFLVDLPLKNLVKMKKVLNEFFIFFPQNNFGKMKGVECIQSSLTNFQFFPQKNIVKMKGVLNVDKV